MKNISPFFIGVIGICALLAVFAMLTFSGVLPGFRGDQGPGVSESIVMWGAVDSDILSDALNNLNFNNRSTFALKYVQKNPNTIDQDLTEALAEGRGPDLVILPHDLMRRHFNKIEPISYETYSEQAFKQTFVPQGDLFLSDVGIYALPWYVDPLVLYYNDQMLTSAGIALPPRYWVDIQDPFSDGILKKITQLDQLNNITQSTIALGQFSNVNHAKDILSLLVMQSGDQIVTGQLGNNEVNFNKGAQSALNFFVQFSDPAKEQYTWNSALPRSIDMFTSSKLAFYLGRASDLELIQKANPHLPFNATVVPQIDNTTNRQTVGQIYGVSVLKTSIKKPAAISAAIAFTGRDMTGVLAEKSFLAPARRDLLVGAGGSSFKNVFYQSALASRGWLDPNPTETNRIFKEMVENVLVGRVSITEAVSRASSQIGLSK